MESEDCDAREWFGLEEAIKRLEGRRQGGLYWIRLKDQSIKYPKGESPVIYIGKSNKDIRSRLKAHFVSKDDLGKRILEEAGSREGVEIGILLRLKTEEIPEIERGLLRDFQERYGSRPRYNVLLDRPPLR